VKDKLDIVTNPDIPVADKIHLLPSVAATANALGGDQEQIDRLIKSMGACVEPVYQKMWSDSNDRLKRTLDVMRAARLFNYTFVSHWRKRCCSFTSFPDVPPTRGP
jgi:hypothetical protein